MLKRIDYKKRTEFVYGGEKYKPSENEWSEIVRLPKRLARDGMSYHFQGNKRYLIDWQYRMVTVWEKVEKP